MIKDLYNVYRDNRRQAKEYQSIMMKGALLFKKIDKLMNSRIFRPNALTIQRLVNEASERRDSLVIYMKSLSENNTLQIDPEELYDFESLYISDLLDCKIVANKYISIGDRLLREKVSFLYHPFSKHLTISEFAIIAFFILLLFLKSTLF